MDCSPPGSSVHGIRQARGLEWGAIAFSNCTCQSALVGKLFLQEMSTRRQHFFMFSSGSTCNQSLKESQLPGMWIRVECAWASTQALLSHHLFPSEASPLPSSLMLYLAVLPAGVPRRLHSQGVLSWGPQHGETCDLGSFLCSSKSEGRAIRISVH